MDPIAIDNDEDDDNVGNVGSSGNMFGSPDINEWIGRSSCSHTTSLTGGLALTWHSIYTSLPSRIESIWIFVPKLIRNCGATRKINKRIKI